MSVLLTRLTDPETNSMRVTVFCSVRLLTRLVCSPTPMCTHQFLSNLPAKRRELPWTSNGQVQCWQNAPAVCLAFVPALREYFAAHARPDGGTPMYMLQSLLGQLDVGFDRASSAAASSSSAAKALFDRARGIFFFALLRCSAFVGSITFFTDDVGAWLRIGFDTRLGLFHSTGVFLNRILDKELVSLKIDETHACSRCSYKCMSVS
jgi:hypothetical protein